VNLILEKKHIILYAKRAIKAGEEITYDYNFECEEEKIQCRCGAIGCQGRLN
jgi:SET domain-containing protein